MPKMGEAHLLLSSTHPDTSPPAGGAAPSDGQVVTWSDLLGAWHAADPPAGVTDHGALSGLVPDDDHTQYALADKSRPSPWVHADGLWTKSIADFATRHHHDLQFLTTDDHPVYINIYGRPGGQTVLGATGFGEHLTLQSTSHATRGYVRAQDDLQLLSNILRDSGGNARITLGTSSPEIALTGDLDVSKHIAVGSGAVPTAQNMIRAVGDLLGNPAIGCYLLAYGKSVFASQGTYGLMGAAYAEGTPAASFAYGLNFFAQHNTSSPCLQLGGIYTSQQSGGAGSGAISIGRGIYIAPAAWGSAKPSTSVGVDIGNQGHASVATAYGLRLADQAATTVRLLELGPAVPYLRLVGGGDPAAGDTNLFLKVGSSLMQVYVTSGYMRVK